ncbi:MAG: disulfide bond formation protein DsbA [Burkholderiales bacterium RIFCSPLOWO2_12_FULL_61_40]|nr:MAG: disulfide bond formation protein DsbA [Burkholderiales bacterium RIFCSPLOWO2_12_FULL_61_40]
MKRREFSQAALGAGLLSSALVSPLAHAQAKKPVAGTDYQVLDPRASVEAPAGKVEVVEFFWYNCPHCNAFEPTMEAWVKKLPKDIAFRRVPVAFRDDFVPQQRLFYALDAMGLVEKLHAKVFAAIHVEKLNLSKGEAITEWVGKQGVDKAKFVEQYNSFSVVTKSGRASKLQNEYKVEGVPALGLAGRFYTDGSMAGSMERALQVVESLVAEVRAKR